MGTSLGRNALRFLVNVTFLHYFFFFTLKKREKKEGMVKELLFIAAVKAFFN